MTISVLMSIYKKENPVYFRQALDSILAQTKIPDEIFIVIDGTLNEELENVIVEYQNKYSIIKSYRFLENVKLGLALQKGVWLCSGELIARMDTDDIARRDRLQKQYEFFQKNPNIQVLGGAIEEFDEKGNRTYKQMPQSMKEILRYSKYRNPINHMTVMFYRKAVLEVGNYQHFPLLEDYELWSRMLAKGYQFFNLSDVLVEMRSGREVYKRRKGWKYFCQHRYLRKKQRKLGLLSKTEYIKSLGASFGFAMQPDWMRKITYHLLRRKR